MRFLFWNVKKKPLEDLTARAVNENAIDTLLLCEAEKINIPRLVERLNSNGGNFRHHDVPSMSHTGIILFSRYPKSSFRCAYQYENRLLVWRVKPPIGCEFLLCCVHLWSGMWKDSDDQHELASRMARYVREQREKTDLGQVVIVGDFNIPPFGRSLVSSESFHAVMTREVAKKKRRTVAGIKRRYYYNPMWSRLGDLSHGPPGTYYYRSSNPINYHWLMLDQVLISSSLVDAFADRQLAILSSIGEANLLDEAGRPDAAKASDHLPIVFELAIERLN